jgi:hypothetical protein
MKKPVKKAVKPARKKAGTLAGSALRAKRKRPVRAAKAAPRVARARTQAFVIPPILLETAPPPLEPLIPESRLVDAQLPPQEGVENIHTPPIQSSKTRFLNISALEVEPIIPTLAHAQAASVKLEPVMAPKLAETVEMAIHVPEPVALSPGVPIMEFHEPERGILHLLARDPHCLFATWDFPTGALALHRLRSADGCLRLMVHAEGHGEGREIVLTAEACEWFIPVARAGTEYRVEMGYGNRSGAWVSIADSAVATTPSEAPAAPATAQMRTVVFPVLEPAAAPVLSAGFGMESVPQVASHQVAEITAASDIPWVPEVQASLEVLSAPVQNAKTPKTPISADSLQLHLAGLERKMPGLKPGLLPGSEAVPPSGGLPSSMAGVFPLPTSFLPGPSGGEAQPESAPARNFWFTVNAELIIYGATEPDARVEIGGHPIRLRPDGGFSFRFALPNGRFELPVAALSADGVEFRGAVLRFERCTQTVGEVGVHPQDSNLKKPAPEACV